MLGEVLVLRLAVIVDCMTRVVNHFDFIFILLFTVFSNLPGTRCSIHLRERQITGMKDILIINCF